MATNYDRLKKNIVTLHGNGADVKILTVEELVNYLNQTPQILDKTEKRYIRNVIAPFWEKVEYVKKIMDMDSVGCYYIAIAYQENGTQFICFPAFHARSGMYANMVENQKYTLEELDIKFK